MSLTDKLAELADYNWNLLKLYQVGSIKRRTLLASLKLLKGADEPGNWKVIQLREEGARTLFKEDPAFLYLPVELAIQRLKEMLPGVILAVRKGD